MKFCTSFKTANDISDVSLLVNFSLAEWQFPFRANTWTILVPRVSKTNNYLKWISKKIITWRNNFNESGFFLNPLEKFQSNYFINKIWVEDFQAQNLQDFRIIIIHYTNEDQIKIQKKCQPDKNWTILK